MYAQPCLVRHVAPHQAYVASHPTTPLLARHVATATQIAAETSVEHASKDTFHADDWNAFFTDLEDHEPESPAEGLVGFAQSKQLGRQDVTYQPLLDDIVKYDPALENYVTKSSAEAWLDTVQSNQLGSEDVTMVEQTLNEGVVEWNPVQGNARAEDDPHDTDDGSKSPTPMPATGTYRYNLAFWKDLSRLLRVASRQTEEPVHHVLDFFRQRIATWRDSTSKQKIPISTREMMSIIIGALATTAKQTLEVLEEFDGLREAEGVRQVVPAIWFDIRADCCYHLRHSPALWAETQTSPELMSSFARQVARLKSVDYWPKYELKARHLDLLLANSTDRESGEILQKFQEIYPAQSDRDLLYLVDCYTRLRDVDGALQALSRVSPQVLHSGDGHCISRCVKLLQLDTVQGEYSARSFRILPRMLQLGVPPLDVIHNMAVQNAAKSGLMEVAFDLYKSLQAENIPIGHRTHNILLKHSLLLRDADALNKCFDIIHALDSLQDQPYLLMTMMNVVRYISFFERRAHPAKCMQYIMQIYDRAHSRHVLARIGLIHPSQVDDGNPELLDPNPMALAGAIWACVLVQRDVLLVNRVWDNLVGLLADGDPLVTESAEAFGLFRAFLLFYTRTGSSLNRAVEVMQYALERHPKRLEETDWVILMAGFIRHEGDSSAEQIRQVMMSTGQDFTSQGKEFLTKRWPSSETVQKILSEHEAGTLPSDHDTPWKWDRSGESLN